MNNNSLSKSIRNAAYRYLKNPGRRSTAAGVPSSVTPAQPEKVGVRSYLKSAGLDDSKIGWSDGQVTYNGRSFTPDENRNGITYANPKKLDSFISDIQSDNGSIGVRKTFSDLGLDTSKLGWRDGKVTYAGAEYTPAVNANGTTYGKRGDVMNFADTALRSKGDNLVRVNQYRDPNGLYDVTWNNADRKVLIGGRNVPYAYIDDDGNAWAKESDISKAYAQLAESRGISPYSAKLDEWKKGADSLAQEYKKISDSEFTFDKDMLENNPVWQAYADMYDRNARKAYLDTIADVSARTGGAVSSMAQVAADEARNRMLQSKTDMIPTISEMAYKQYTDGLSRKSDMLDRRYGLYNDALKYGTDFSDRARALYANEQESERRRKTNLYADRASELELASAQDAYEMQRAKNAYDTADMFNVPISEETAEKFGVQPDENGIYPTPNQITIAKQREIWEKYEKGIYDYETAAELDKYIRQQEIAMGYALNEYESKQRIKQQYTPKTSSKKKTSIKNTSKNGGDINLENELAALGGGF